MKLKKYRVRMVLKEGEVYTFRFRRYEEDNPFSKDIVSKRVRCIKKYTHHALFEHTNGIKECFTYWEITKAMKGEIL
jgi:hypothetical protein